MLRAVLSGPNLARELTRGVPTAAVFATINAVINGELSPSVAVEELMTRAAREEFPG